MRLSFAAPVLKGGHEVIVELRDHNAVGEKGASAPEPPRRAHHASTQPVGKGLVMKKILSLTFAAMLSVALAAPAYAGRGHGGGFHGGHHVGFHHGGGFHGGCCWVEPSSARSSWVRLSCIRTTALRITPIRQGRHSRGEECRPAPGHAARHVKAGGSGTRAPRQGHQCRG